jgi:predicted ATPase/class 3 adenylate cyclase
MIRTEMATVVFTDIVGSTELASRLGFEAYESLRRSHFKMLRLAVSAHQGSEIKSTGDGLTIAFTSAGEAVACMIRMQQMVALAARRQGGEPKIRIGASCGEISRDGNDIFGITVVEAARLCAAASPDQILVSDLVRALTRGLAHKFVAAGEFNLKGLPDPILACMVEWPPPEESNDVIALPPKIAPVPAFGLYGRAGEEATIERCWIAGKRGQRQIVLLAGEPGIGKTRLAMEAGRIAHRDGAVVLFGSCDEDIGYPYRPFVEALRHYVLNARDDVLLQHVQDHNGELLRIVPTLAERVPGVPKPQMADAESERYLMFEAVAGLLALASHQSPILLILDDLQWAGMPELLLLKHILRSTMPMNLLVIGTYRDTELSRTHPLTPVLADLRRDVAFERIALRGLDEEGVVDFVAAAAGHELDEIQLALARAISRDTEGSPLFVGEVLRNLMESGAAFRQGERWQVSGDIQNLGIPEGVKEAIGRRLSRLSATTNKILSLASVIGREFDLVLLKQIAGTSEDALLDAIDEAESAALVVKIASDLNRYVFTHVLVRTTLYDELNPTRRARMHERVGGALERLTVEAPDQRIDELARHWLVAATNVANAKKAIGFARRAADQALAGLAFEQAAEYYRHALSVLDDDDRDTELLRCDLLIALSDAQRRAGDPSYRQTSAQAIQIARAQGDKKHFALAALGSARPDHPFTNANVVDESLIALYEEAIADLGDEGNVILRAKLYSCLAGEMLYTPQRERRRELARQSVEMARQAGDTAVLAQALHIYASAINDPTTLNERLALSAEQIALADELASRETCWAAAYQRMGALLESGDVSGAKEMLVRMKELAGKLRQPFFSWATDHAWAMISVMSGLSSAEQEVQAAFQTGTAGGQPEVKQAYFGQLSVIRRDQGRHAELIEPLRALADSLSHLPVWRVVLAGLYCETDQLDEARAQIDMLGAGDFKIPLDWTWPSIVISLAQVCSDLGDQKLASLFYPQLQAVAGQVGVTGIGLVCYGSLAYPCGQLAACLHRWDEAEQYCDQAVAVNARIGARPYLVRSQRAYASMLLDRNAPGDRARAAELIAEAHIDAVQIGMQREIVRLERLRCQMERRAIAAV